MDYQIVCTEQRPFGVPPDHQHIVAVGTGNSAGWNKNWTLDQVLAAMRSGDRFYTVSPSTGKTALVEPFHCTKCSRTYIRSKADAVRDNNLDNLPRCG